jgi:uncharacterized membrane protein HdeD (DUF308 family)
MNNELMTLKSLTDVWWLIVMRGVVSIGLGLVALAVPTKTVALLVLFVGLLLMVDGVINVISSLLSIKKTDKWWVVLIQGIIGLFLGVVVFNYPQVTVGVILFLVALWAIITGIMLVVTAISTRKESYGGWLLTAGALIAIGFGIVLLANPYQTVVVVTMLVGLFAVISGIITVALGLEVHSVRKDTSKLIKEGY